MAERGHGFERLEPDPAGAEPERSVRFRLAGHARAFAFLVLAGVTAYGVFAFAAGDWGEVIQYWRNKLPSLPWILLLVVGDVAIEGICWVWVYERMGIRAYLAGRAGLLLPAQLGRLIRPDTMTRLGRAPLSRCLQAEATSFVLDATSVGMLLAGLIAYTWHPLAGPVVALAVAAVPLSLGDVLAARLSGSRLSLPVGFWWRWQTLGIVLVQMFGWAVHGAALYVMIRDLPGHVTLWNSLFYSAASSVGGVGSGLPGGIGATEGLLGASLRIMEVPAAHLALAVAAFRIVTFWMWIPLGWLALVMVRRHATGSGRAARDAVHPPASQPAAAEVAQTSGGSRSADGGVCAGGASNRRAHGVPVTAEVRRASGTP
jgi:uncharacterized membrane protein YbhN (UPF0104 family)